MIIILIPGNPIPKGRPKFVVRGKFASAYTPLKTRKAERSISEYAMMAMRGQKPLEGALKCVIEAFMPIPKSTNKKNTALMAANQILHTKKPDLDNIGKLALDAMNGIVYIDDSQIVHLTLVKQYSDEPRLSITVYEDKKRPLES